MENGSRNLWVKEFVEMYRGDERYKLVFITLRLDFLMTSVVLISSLIETFYFFNIMISNTSLGSRRKKSVEEWLGPCCIKWKAETKG